MSGRGVGACRVGSGGALFFLQIRAKFDKLAAQRCSARTRRQLLKRGLGSFAICEATAVIPGCCFGKEQQALIDITMHIPLDAVAATGRDGTFGFHRIGCRGRRRGAAAAAIGAVATLLTGGSVHAQTLDARSSAVYVTVMGDSLYEVAQRYLTDPGRWRALAGLNHISAPRRLPAGMVLRLPISLLRRDAVPVNVVAMSGLVTLKIRSRPADMATVSAIPLLPGRTLGENDAVTTGPDGFATLETADGSYVSLTPNSSIVLSILRKMVLTGINERVIELRKGEVTNEVTHAKQPGDGFEVRTPSIVAGVRGTHFRVNVAPTVTAVEVLDGKVALGATADTTRSKTERPAAASQLVAAGEGSATPNGGAIGAPQPLLPAPRLVDPSKVQDGQAVTFDVVPAANAGGYRVQIARDADLLDLIRDARVQAPRAVFADVPDGTYFVRVSAIAADGLEGVPRVYAFERRANELTATAAPGADSREYHFIWRASRADADADADVRYRFVLSAHRDLHDPLVDAVDLRRPSLVVADLPPGDYYWRVVAEQYDRGRFYETSGPVRAFTLAH